ncbi:MAG: hypothetical protein KY454_05630 [Actinobacteria bacterium]|nr:hypothetical protein [Actinomycetota bacterium]MBW3649687.1 hypothetical protein [Actinomycetota bacterium]
MKLRWSQLGGQMGIGLGLLGLLLVFLGWNGAASYDRVPAQFPYLISGGIAGLSLVVLGAALLIVQNARRDRAALQQTVAELRVAVERLASAGAAPANGGAGGVLAGVDVPGMVVAGTTSYHRPSCRLLEGRGVLPTMPAGQAEGQGLSPCRICDAGDDTLPVAEPVEAGGSRRRRR